MAEGDPPGKKLVMNIALSCLLGCWYTMFCWTPTPGGQGDEASLMKDGKANTGGAG